jgi:Cdc6-like AAA superfamily ATPase
MARVLSPSQPIQSPEHLKGRDRQLRGIEKALYVPGRHIFIYGYRGVGKTSLAHTAAFQHQSPDNHPILLTASELATFFTIIHDMFKKSFPSDPRVIRDTLKAGAGLKFGGLSADVRRSIEKGQAPLPKTVNEAVELTDFIASTHSAAPVVLIDEFDLLKAKGDHALFAAFIKQVSDQKIPIRFVFCGVGESVEDFFDAHDSIYRYFYTEKLDRLDFNPRLEIIEAAADALEIRVDNTSKYRIATVSDGFPHFIHLICEKLFWQVFEDKRSKMNVHPDHYEAAIQDAVADVQPYLKRPYEKATRKYTNDYEEVLWAVADNYQLSRSTREILESYLRIMQDLGKDPLPKRQFYTRMNAMKKETHGSILTGTRSGWYEFKEKMMRGYARMRAEQAGIELDAEHPLQARRTKSVSRLYASRYRNDDFEDDEEE